jgi:ABC-2 type transport system ATP-binding protein
MIKLENIVKRFNGCVALDGISLDMHEGKTYGLCGRNGAGKTTLLRVLSGILSPEEGVVRVLDKDPAKEWRIRRQMGIVEDGDAYFPELTVVEFLWWVGRLRDLTDEQCNDETEQLTHMFYIDKKVDDLISSLSHGMRRKVLIASVFIGRPRIIMLDEPTNGLDVDSLDVLYKLLDEHRQNGGLAIIACHDSCFIDKACSDVVTLVEGRIVRE